MTEQEAFEKWFHESEAPYTEYGKEMAKIAWQARGEYEAERVKKLVEAAENVVAFCRKLDLLRPDERRLSEAIREYQGGDNDR